MVFTINILWPFSLCIKKANSCKSYLILRDIFPEWAVDLGLMSRGPYLFFKLNEKFSIFCG